MLARLTWRIGAFSQSARSSQLSQSRALSSQHAFTRRPRLQLLPRHVTKPQTRPYTYYQRWKDDMRIAARDVHRKHPIAFPLTLLFAIGSTGFLFYVIYDFVVRINPQYSRFPSQVAAPLRKAVYFTSFDPNPPVALAHYKEALQAAHQVGLHPFSDEVLGIRLMVGAMLDEAHLTKAAIEVLEKIKTDCQTWVDDGRRRKLILDREREEGKEELPNPADPDAVAAYQAMLEMEREEEVWRYRVIKKVPGISIKLAELYTEAQEPEKVEGLLMSALEICRAELQRRRDLKLPVSADDGHAFMTLTDVGNAFNDMADHYAGKSNNDLAATLYMQALSLFKEDERDGQNKGIQVVLLNNISSQMAEHAQKLSPGAPVDSSSISNPVSREQLLSAAAEWAKKAIDVASHIEPANQDETCHQARLTALYNLGEIAEMQDNLREAEACYLKAKASAAEVDFAEGVTNADAALKRIQKLK